MRISDSAKGMEGKVMEGEKRRDTKILLFFVVVAIFAQIATNSVCFFFVFCFVLFFFFVLPSSRISFCIFFLCYVPFFFRTLQAERSNLLL